MNRTLALLLVTVFFNIAGFSLILPLLPFYGSVFGASSTAIAGLFAAYSFGNLFGEIFWGRRSDLMGRKPVLVLTTAGAAASYVAFAYTSSLEAAIVVRIIGGFFSGTLGVVQSAIADITPPADRARKIGYFGATFNLGFATGPTIGGLLATPGAGLPGFRAPILAAAAFTAAASVWALCALRETRPANAGRRPSIRYGEAFHYVAHHPLLVRLFVIAFCGIAAFSSMEAVFGLWTQRNFGWTSREVGLAFLFVGAAGLMVQALLIGPLVRRFGEARIIIGGLVLLFFSILLPPLVRMPQASVLLMAMLMMGHSFTFPNAGALVSRTAPRDRQGSVMGLNMASNAASRIVAPVFFGWIYSRNADAPYYVCALLVLAMLPVAWGVMTLRERAALA